jgi:hypothetical protein
LNFGHLKNLEDLFQLVDPVIASRLTIGLKGLDSLVYDEEDGRLSIDPSFYSKNEDCPPKEFKFLPNESVVRFLVHKERVRETD